MSTSGTLNSSADARHYWRIEPAGWFVLTLVSALGIFLFRDALIVMVSWWSDREEYSHGFLVPVVTAYLIWQRSDRLREIQFSGSWTGVAVVLLGLLMYLMGELSTIYAVIQYGFVIFAIGVAWAYLGTAAFRVIAVPLCLLFFMVPFPNFIYNNLSSQLQLLSSEIGVAVIRLFGITVYLEGNVIDLGSFKLQVVEACDGLRYLFPLMTLGVIVAYFYHAAMWKRLLLFVSTVPITILMNSFRIGVIGVMVEHWGQSMAEGFLHDFEGWAIFMACFGILFLEMWLLMRVTGDRRPLAEAFGIDPPRRAQPGMKWISRQQPRALLVTVLLAALAVGLVQGLPQRIETPPEREVFASFPLALTEWQGQNEKLEQMYIDTLKLSDYALVNYRDESGRVVNFYSAYYTSQAKGQSAHSPKSCLPGGGWIIESLDTHRIPDVAIDGILLTVNRAVIAQGDSRQLVYYWFQQRGRVMTNEYLVKWYVFWDALTRNRTDGALVRIVGAARPGESIDDVDAALERLAARIAPLLPTYIPK